MYYVGSRYYDAGLRRFISADTTDILGVDSDLYDKNLYAYCDKLIFLLIVRHIRCLMMLMKFMKR